MGSGVQREWFHSYIRMTACGAFVFYCCPPVSVLVVNKTPRFIVRSGMLKPGLWILPGVLYQVLMVMVVVLPVIHEHS